MAARKPFTHMTGARSSVLKDEKKKVTRPSLLISIKSSNQHFFSNIKGKQLNLNQRAYVQQGHVGEYTYTQNAPICYLTTSGIGPCVGLIAYNRESKHGVIAHIDTSYTLGQYKQYLKLRSSMDASVDNSIVAEFDKEQKRIHMLLSEIAKKINYRANDKTENCQVSVIYTDYHNEHKDGYPLFLFIEKALTSNEIKAHEVLNASGRRNSEDVYLDLMTGKVGRYPNEVAGAVQGFADDLNHPEGLHYFEISETGLLNPIFILKDKNRWESPSPSSSSSEDD